MWIRDRDKKQFDSEEDAWLDSIENETHDDLLDTLICLDWLIPYSTLLEWAMEQDGFWERFQDEISEARQRNFEEDYSDIEDDDIDILRRMGVIEG